MSRPDVRHHHTFSPFGNPFWKIFSTRPHSSPKLLSLLNDFEQMLAASLTNLTPKESSEVLSLSWMRLAVESLSEIHTNIKGLITDLQFPVSDWDEKWMNEYLDGSVKLLDMCIALSSELSRLDQGQLLLHHIMRVMEHSRFSSEQLRRADASLRDWNERFNSKNRKLKTCDDLLLVTPFGKAKDSDKGRVLIRALYGVKAQIVIVCGVITSALSGCSKDLLELHVPDEFLWSRAFRGLQTVVLSEIRSHLSSEKVIVLKELEAVELCVERLSELTRCLCGCEEAAAGRKEGRKLEELVSDLAERSEKLSEGLDLLLSQIDGFFRVVVSGRDALLSNLRASSPMREDR